MLGVFSDYLDRGAKARLCSRIEEHLKECPDCRMYVDTLRKTVVLYRGLGDEKVPAPVERRLFKTIRLAGMRTKNGPKPGLKTVARGGCSRSRQQTKKKRS